MPHVLKMLLKGKMSVAQIYQDEFDKNPYIFKITHFKNVIERQNVSGTP